MSDIFDNLYFRSIQEQHTITITIPDEDYKVIERQAKKVMFHPDDSEELDKAINFIIKNTIENYCKRNK